MARSSALALALVALLTACGGDDTASEGDSSAAGASGSGGASAGQAGSSGKAGSAGLAQAGSAGSAGKAGSSGSGASAGKAGQGGASGAAGAAGGGASGAGGQMPAGSAGASGAGQAGAGQAGAGQAGAGQAGAGQAGAGGTGASGQAGAGGAGQGGAGGAAGQAGQAGAGGDAYEQACWAVGQRVEGCAAGAGEQERAKCLASRTCAEQLIAADLVAPLLSCMAQLPCDQPLRACLRSVDVSMSSNLAAVKLFQTRCSDKSKQCSQQGTTFPPAICDIPPVYGEQLTQVFSGCVQSDSCNGASKTCMTNGAEQSAPACVDQGWVWASDAPVVYP